MKNIFISTLILLSPPLLLADRVGIRVAADGRVKIVECASKNTLSLPVANNYPPIDAGIQFMPIEVETLEDPIDPEVAKLQKLDAIDFNIKDGSLASAIKLCAKACNMNYIAPPNDPVFNEPITLDIRNNPYLVLKLLCKTYNIGFEHNDGMWQFYPINLNELIQKTYKLKYNSQEQFKITSPSVNTSIGQSNAAALGGNTNAASSDVFNVKTNVVVEEIEKIIALPTTGVQAIDTQSAVDNPAQAHLKSTAAPKGSVIYSSDNNEIIVVATRQHHSYIERYLKTVDQPQRLIKIEALLVETSRNPQSDFGVDWSGVSGTKIGLSDIASAPINLNKSLSGVYMPFATLSASDMAVTLNFIKSDTESSISQDPTVVTVNNKEVALKSVQQQPIESGSSQENNLGSRNNVSTIDYVEIGTIINIHPKIMEDHASSNGLKSVQLNVSLVVSSEIGKQLIGGKEYPIISSRTYNYTVVVPSGETLAIGGLSETYNSTTDKSVPILCDIPIIGAAFSNKSNVQRKRNLVAYITPTIFN